MVVEGMIKNRILCGFFMVLLLFVFLTGCSTNRSQLNVFNAFYAAYSAVSEDNSLTREAAQKLPYASLQVSLNGNNPVIMVLGTDLSDRQKWYSKDRFSFTTQSARVTQVYNVKSELSSIRPSLLWQRFLINNIALNQKITLPLELDFLSLKRFAVKAVVTLHGVGFENRMLWGKPVNLLRIEEEVTIPSMGYRYTNIYWKDTKTGFIWESIQKWGPDVPEIHYQVMKPWQKVSKP